MLFKKKSEQPGDFPPVPPSLNHDSFEMSEKRDNVVDGTRMPRANTAGSVTPYLGLRARLSQIWLNRWTVLLLLVLVHVLITLATLNDGIGSAKTKALSACTKVEDIGSAMASMPHYLSVGVNRMASKGITEAVSAMVSVLMMILTGVESLIMFVINYFVGTYICLTSALIHGGLDIGIGAADLVTKTFNDNINKIVDDLNGAVKSVADEINTVASAINNIPFPFGSKPNIPTIDFSKQIDAFSHIQIDDKAFVQSLNSLNSTIPTYDDVEKFANSALSIPFDFVRDALTKAYGNYTFDDSVFPVAKKEALTFCSGNSDINNFFDSLYEMAATAKIAFMVVLIVLAVLACIPMAWLEVRGFRKEQRIARAFTKDGYDPMDTVYIASQPNRAIFGIKLGSRLSGKRQLLIRWMWAYFTSPVCIFILSLAIAAFFSAFCQWIILRAVQAKAPELADKVGDFAGEVVTTLEDVSVKWADDANGVITHFTDEINNDVLGYVVNATTAVNDTLNTFTTEISKGIDDVFGGTVLDNTIQQIVRCLIGIKVEAVEKGLTWVHDHARVSLPLFPNDTFAVGAQKSIDGDSDLTSFLASPSSVTTDEITGAVDQVMNYLLNNIIQSALIGTGLMLAWVIAALIGIVAAMARMITPDRTRGEGGQRYYTGDGRTPIGSPRRAKSEAGDMRFPRFGEDRDGSTPVDSYAESYPSEKQMPSGAVKSGRALKSPGHIRSSSYGHVEDSYR